MQATTHLRAGDESRTRNLRITNALLCQLSYASIVAVAPTGSVRRVSDAHGVPEPCQNGAGLPAGRERGRVPYHDGLWSQAVSASFCDRLDARKARHGKAWRARVGLANATRKRARAPTSTPHDQFPSTATSTRPVAIGATVPIEAQRNRARCVSAPGRAGFATSHGCAIAGCQATVRGARAVAARRSALDSDCRSRSATAPRVPSPHAATPRCWRVRCAGA